MNIYEQADELLKCSHNALERLKEVDSKLRNGVYPVVIMHAGKLTKSSQDSHQKSIQIATASARDIDLSVSKIEHLMEKMQSRIVISSQDSSILAEKDNDYNEGT